MRLKQLRKVVFEPITHTYLMGDKELIGVTTLMRKHGLGANYDGIPEDVLMKAAERGTRIHEYLEDYDNGVAVEGSRLLDNYRSLGLKIIASEYLVSDNKMVASSIDKVQEVDETTVDLMDVKTTSTFHTEAVSWQLSIYKKLFEAQNKGVKVRDLYGIHVDPKKETVKLIKVEEVAPERVKALLDAEARGEIYQGESEVAVPTAEGALTEEEVSMVSKGMADVFALQAQIKEIESHINGYKERVLQYMEDNHLEEISIGEGVVRKKAATMRKGIDTKALKERYPDIAEELATESQVKASLIYKPNKQQ